MVIIFYAYTLVLYLCHIHVHCMATAIIFCEDTCLLHVHRLMSRGQSESRCHCEVHQKQIYCTGICYLAFDYSMT